MQSRAAAFWAWFADWHIDVTTAYENGDDHWLAMHLSAEVRNIEPRLNWEIGPYHHPDKTLVISPTVRDNIKLTENVVAAAPSIVDWHFLPAKPAKKLKTLGMSLPGIAGAEVCADTWVYRLTAYNRMEFFDIELYSDHAGALSDGHLEMLARRLIECLVGELVYLEKIAAVKVYGADVKFPEPLTPLPCLGRHLSHLLRSG